jgi:hypothetical protein
MDALLTALARHIAAGRRRLAATCHAMAMELADMSTLAGRRQFEILQRAANLIERNNNKAA